MKINSGCLVVVMALSSFFAQGQLPYKEVINNYKSFLIAQDTTPIDSVKHWCSSLKSNGEWASVDYLDKNSSSWKTSEHLNRVVKLSITYHRPSSIFYHDASVWGKIILATNHWVEKKYVNSNWWYNEIGIPQFWRDIITLNFEKFDKLELSNALALLAQHKLKATFTGANLVWSADLAMHYGIFTSDEGLVTKASKLIIDEVKISKNEGIRPDFSFHQHGARLQTHHYGASFLKDNIRLAYELKNTPWSFPESKIIILKDFLVEGWQWMERGIYLTPATLDRSVSRRGFLVQDLSPLLPYFIKLFPKGTVKDLETMLAVQQGATPSLSGFKYFPYADFATLQDKKFSFFLKTISSRTEVTERINGENQKGTFLNLGNTYFIRNGKEYFDLMPVWDWGKLPGTTNFKSAKTIKRLPFVGGVYAGTSGLAVMDFETESEKSKLTANKFWVMHNGRVFCLIANIKLQGEADRIFTTLEQSRLQGKVIANANWVHHNGFTYASLTANKLEVSDKMAMGSWSALSKSGPTTPIVENVFKVVLNHPNNSAASYLVDGLTPIKNIKQMLAKPHWQILKNTEACQAIAFKDGISMFSFHKEGELHTDNINIKVNKACLMIVDKENMYLSDPLHVGEPIEIILNTKKIMLTLPSDGTSIKCKL